MKREKFHVKKNSVSKVSVVGWRLTIQVKGHCSWNTGSRGQWLEFKLNFCLQNKPRLLGHIKVFWFYSKIAKICYLRFYEELISDLLSYIRRVWSDCVRTH